MIFDEPTSGATITMTVKELIAKLQEFDGEANVWRNDSEYGVEEIYNASIMKKEDYIPRYAKEGDVLIS